MRYEQVRYKEMRYEEADIDIKTPESVLSEVRAVIAADFLSVLMVSPWDPDGAVLIAEAANAWAKYTGDYNPKVAAFAAAAQLPAVESGWGDDGCFYLSSEGVGEVCAHDPFGELARELDRWGYRHRAWAKRWSGIRRQHLIGLALENKEVRRLFAWATTEGAGVRQETVERIIHRLLKKGDTDE